MDSSIPAARKIGRWVTHLWVFVETLSFRIGDSMCGFRVYPLAACHDLLAQRRPGLHMEFDTEIMVRLFWNGVPPIAGPSHWAALAERGAFWGLRFVAATHRLLGRRARPGSGLIKVRSRRGGVPRG